ncbi:hypothetical protein OAB81_02975 [Flavobacteriaceae bacterium]|nr:hypothetical protein [Flavobacteriaceae bacterium]
MKETIIDIESRKEIFDEPLHKKSLEQRVEHIVFLWEQYNEYDDEDRRLGYEEGEDYTMDERLSEIEDERYDLQSSMVEIHKELQQILQMN